MIQGMKELRNRMNKQQAMAKLATEDFKRKTVSFYRYVTIDNPKDMRDELFAVWGDFGVLGRIYVSQEGINAQISVPETQWKLFVEHVHSIPQFAGIPFKIAVEEPDTSFWKLIIKVRKQIVADGLDFGEYDIENVGNHLTAREWNEAMEDPDTVVVDMRNHYESEIGHFDDALCHPVDTFREQLPMVAEDIADKKDQKVLLYCTGGIRCEKASAYLKHRGFTDVNQLHGGVIDYAHQVKREGLEHKFKGSNYVFDGRNRENISGEIISECHQCGNSCDMHTNCLNKACNLLFIQCEDCALQMSGCCTKKCKKVTSWSEEKQKRYYKKHGDGSQRAFSKSLQARARLSQQSPWQKIRALFS